MRYVCLVYVEPSVLEAMSAEEVERLKVEAVEYDILLRKRGRVIAAGPLKPVDTATTVRSRGGKVVMIDGPYAESKEVLGGFLCVDVDSKEEALQIAAAIPMARYGSIEVRQMQAVGACCS